MQQLLYGLRDQRVLASAGVLLLSISFGLCAFDSLRAGSPRRFFAMQFYSFFAIVSFFSLIQLELSMQRLHPISFEYEGKYYKDYAYLLTNSFDNSTSWLELIDEAERTGIPVPEAYYWGSYTSLCGYGGSYIKTARSVFRDRYDYLLRKYGPSGSARGLRGYLRANLRELQAFYILKEHYPRVKQFMAFVDNECKSRRPYT